MANNATIYDVAGAAGVSLATVSRVLNNPDKVKKETRERVLRVIKELGYRPNVIARGLASRKTTTVGVIVSDMTRASVAEMLGGISDIARKYKYSIKLFTIDEFADISDELHNIIAEQVDGVLYLNDELTEAEVAKVKKIFNNNNTPFVFANVASEDPTVAAVNIDYKKAGYEITKAIIDDNTKEVYLLSTTRRYATNDLKEQGYIEAMEEAGLVPNIFRTSGDTKINRPHFETFFDDKKVDAAIGVRDSIAVSFMNSAIEHGKKVPEDLHVAGFQNTKYAELSRPKLTSINIPVYEIGASSMQLLTQMMHNEKVDQIKIILPHKIIYRESTKIK
ncbi:LacI family DNA-binding transcriptional regulator [Haploplasma modicum]|jgi:LacI family transcriptional regulator|uniref:LacI family DNA-binding transcriptional regulator n=1 Tax=Haploplasma modicum TaxID=2150 RepID=UPI000478BC09|nr:LacI family DNA-binding transcriptional regulator [Haploplasma modicum]